MTQRNTQFIDSLDDGFDVHDSVHELCKRIAANWGNYSDLGNGHPPPRLRARLRILERAGVDRDPGAGGTLTPSQLAWIEAYIDRVTSLRRPGGPMNPEQRAEAPNKLLVVERDALPADAVAAALARRSRASGCCNTRSRSARAFTAPRSS